MQRKYTEDFEVFDVLNEHGKIVNNVKYVGAWYDFDDSKKAEKRRKSFPFFCILLWIFFILPFQFFSYSFFYLWIIAPYALVCIPLGFFTGMIISTRRKEPLLWRQVADLFSVRCPACCFSVFILSAYVMAAVLVAVFFKVIIPVKGDFILLISACASFTVSLYLYCRRKEVEVHLVDLNK